MAGWRCGGPSTAIRPPNPGGHGAPTAAYAVSSHRLPNAQGFPHALTSHVACPVVPVGFPGVVRLAPEAQVDSGVRAALAPRMHVSKFEAPCLVAAVTVFAHKTAAPVVARPHFAPHGDSEVTSPPSGGGGSRGRGRWLGLGLLCSRLVGDAGLAPFDLSQERIERALDDRSGVAVRNLVGEQILELLELVACVLAECHLESVATR